MKTPEVKICPVCNVESAPVLDPDEAGNALTEALGEAVFVEMSGVMTVNIGENIVLEVNIGDMDMTASVAMDLQSHEPMEGEPDYDKFIGRISILPRLSALLIKLGFKPREWRVNEYRGPGNGACSITLHKPITSKKVEDLVREVRDIKHTAEAPDS